MYNMTAEETVVLGKQSDMSFKMSGDNMLVIFTRTEEDKESSVSLQCTPKGKRTVLYAPLEKIIQVVSNTKSITFTFIVYEYYFVLLQNLVLYSPFACTIDHF